MARIMISNPYDVDDIYRTVEKTSYINKHLKKIILAIIAKTIFISRMTEEQKQHHN